MWVMAMFDLPVYTKEQCRTASGFRKSLILKGFTMLQKSIYIRCVDSTYDSTMAYLMARLPKEGKVSFIKISDQLFSSSIFIENSCEKPPPEAVRRAYIF